LLFLHLFLASSKRVWNLQGTNEEIAREAIIKTELFFQRLGIHTKISEYSSDTEHIAEIIKTRFIDRSWLAMGERQAITPTDVESIVLQAI